jgi:ribosomal protein S18 acetylase RimI-like enzyme
VLDETIELRHLASGAGDVCRRILADLPTWFGIPEANEHYALTAEATGSTIASVGGEDVGITTVVDHSPHAAEIYLMAVLPSLHRRGVGTAMLRHVEAQLARRGVEFLQVKTLSPARPDEGYDKTRAFYLGYGFRVLEEFPELWDPSNPALQLVKSVPETL